MKQIGTWRGFAIHLSVACFVLVAGLLRGEGELPVYSWDVAHEHVGEDAIVRGKVVVAKNIGSVCVLNFHVDYLKYTTVAIYREDWSRFEKAPALLFRGKEVAVAGRIERYRGRPQIVVRGPEQIRVIEPEEIDGDSEAAPAPEPVKLRWTEAHEHLGKVAAVEGRIVSARNIGTYCFLDFAADFESYVSVVVGSEDFANFPKDPELYYLGRRVRVIGEIVEFQDRPEILIHDADALVELPEVDKSDKEHPDRIERIHFLEAENFVGRWVTIEDKIRGAHNTGKVVRLDFRPGGGEGLTLVMFAKKFRLFSREPETRYLNQRVRVEGLIRRGRGGLELHLEAPKQIKVLEGGIAERVENARTGPQTPG